MNEVTRKTIVAESIGTHPYTETESGRKLREAYQELWDDGFRLRAIVPNDDKEETRAYRSKLEKRNYVFIGDQVFSGDGKKCQTNWLC
jgi:hypothetical protein|tara:strand:+ start:258 stop:521 length:264 start_codon:yes stop_codon:yes gene_type:complete